MSELFGMRYHILETIGEGSMGKVMKARDTWLGRIVALKVLHSYLLEEKKVVSAINPLRRFFREARELARLEHTNIISIYDLGEYNEVPYIVMPFIDGVTLDGFLAEEHPSFELKLSIAIDICEALFYAHSMEIVHRDLKPSNIMITKDCRAKIMDFGLSRRMDSNTDITASSSIIGTAHYISPEQAVSSKVDNRADLYSLGVILYEMFTGKKPFYGNNMISLILQHLNVSPRPPGFHNPHLDRGLEDMILKLLEKEPDKRYSSGKEIADELKAIKSGSVRSSEKTFTGKVNFNIRLIGRDNILSRMISLVELLRSGTGSLCVMTGTCGSGKTRLLNEVSNVAKIRNINILKKELTPIDSFSTFHCLPADFFYKDSIDKTTPFPGEILPSKEELLQGCGMLNISEYIVSKIKNIASSPLMVIIDDLHLATCDTQKLIAGIICETIKNKLPILWFISFQELDLSPLSPFFDCLNLLYEMEMIELIHLEPLNLLETSDFIKEFSGNKDMKHDDMEKIFHLSGAIPFHLEEILLLGVSERPEEILKFRFNSFRDNKLLPLVSVCGGRISPYKYKEIFGEFYSEVYEELCLSNILVYDQKSLSFYFRHPLYNLFVYDNISMDIKKELHSKVASFIALEKYNNFIDFTDLCYHLINGKLLPDTLSHLIEYNNKIFSAGAYKDSFSMSILLLNKLNRVDFADKRLYEKQLYLLKENAIIGMNQELKKVKRN